MNPPPSPNASPQPILPGVPVPFPCWLAHPDTKRWLYVTGWHERTDAPSPEQCGYTHYLVASATADTATFPKAEGESVVGTGLVYRNATPGSFGPNEWLDLLMACQDGRATCLRVMEFIERETMPKKPHMLSADELYEALGVAVQKIEAAGGSVPLTDAVIVVGDIRQSIGNRWNKADNYAADRVRQLLSTKQPATQPNPNTEASPSAGTEQKERGDAKLCVHALPLHECKQMECRIRSLKTLTEASVPTVGTTTPTPRTDEAVTDYQFASEPKLSPLATPRVDAATAFPRFSGGLVAADFARQLEREIADWKDSARRNNDDAWKFAKERDELSARLALAEKRLGEAQGEARQNLADAETLERERDISQARLVEVEKERDGLSTELNDVCFSLGCDRANAGGHPADVADSLRSQAKVCREDAEHNATRSEKAEAALVQAKQGFAEKRADMGRILVDLRAANTALSAQVEELKRDGEDSRRKWTQTPPTEQGTYWHWNGDEDCAPLLMFVLWSGTTGKCFVSMGQLGIEHAIDYGQYGGWWMPLYHPAYSLAARAHVKQTDVSPIKNNFPSINVSSSGEAPGSLLDA